MRLTFREPQKSSYIWDTQAAQPPSRNEHLRSEEDLLILDALSMLPSEISHTDCLITRSLVTSVLLRETNARVKAARKRLAKRYAMLFISDEIRNFRVGWAKLAKFGLATAQNFPTAVGSAVWTLSKARFANSFSCWF